MRSSARERLRGESEVREDERRLAFRDAELAGAEGAFEKPEGIQTLAESSGIEENPDHGRPDHAPPRDPRSPCVADPRLHLCEHSRGNDYYVRFGVIHPILERS